MPAVVATPLQTVASVWGGFFDNKGEGLQYANLAAISLHAVLILNMQLLSTLSAFSLKLQSMTTLRRLRQLFFLYRHLKMNNPGIIL